MRQGIVVAAAGRMRTLAMAAAIAATIFASATAARAVIKVDFDLRDLSGISAQSLVGKVTAVDAKTSLVTVEIEKDFKARPFEKVQRIDLSAAPDLVKEVRVGGPVVFLTGRVKGAILHLADTMCVAEESAAGAPPTWKVDKKYDTWWTFPGQTDGLIQCLDDCSKKQYKLLSDLRHRIGFHYRTIMNLGGKAVGMAAGDFGGDKIPDLLVSMPDGVRLYLTEKPGYDELQMKDVTAAWGLAGVKVRLATFGDATGDGRQDLLLDATLYVNAGDKFVKSPAIPPVADFADIATAAIADVTGDGKADVLMLTRKGEYRVYENPGATDKPWAARPPVALWTPASVKPAADSDKFKASGPVDGTAIAALFGRWGVHDELYVMVVRADGVFRYPLDPKNGKPSDFDHLCGRADKGSAVADLNATTAVVSVNLDGRYDRQSFYIVCSPYPDLALANRGYGCFVANTKMGDWRTALGEGRTSGKMGTKERFKVVAMVAGDFNRQDKYEELVFATEDGKLCIQDNDNAGAKGGKAAP